MRAARMESTFSPRRLPLAVKGSLAKTFWGPGIFIVVNLSLFGIYLVTEAIREPLAADQATVIGAGVSLALAAFILLFLMRFKWRAARAKHEAEDEDQSFEMSLTAYDELLHTRMEAELALKAGRNLPGPM
jgi:hypothetical protein